MRRRRAVGPRRLRRREPAGGELRHAHAVELGLEALDRRAGRRGRLVAADPVDARDVGDAAADGGEGGAGHAPGGVGLDRAHRAGRRRDRRGQLVVVAGDGVRAGAAGRRPGRDLRRPGRSARTCACARTGAAASQLAVGVAAVAVRAPARVAASRSGGRPRRSRTRGAAPSAATVAVTPARGVVLVPGHLVPWATSVTLPASYSIVVGSSAFAAAGSPTCMLTGRPRASYVVVFSPPRRRGRLQRPRRAVVRLVGDAVRARHVGGQRRRVERVPGRRQRRVVVVAPASRSCPTARSWCARARPTRRRRSAGRTRVAVRRVSPLGSVRVRVPSGAIEQRR